MRLKFFKIQSKQNLIYKKYIETINIDPSKIKSLNEIPFLPIDFFKEHKIILKNQRADIVFSSSGTSGTNRSKHFVRDLNIYIESFLKGFQYFFGNINDFVVLALLPSYLEREGSSLIYMVEHLIRLSGRKQSGFFLNNHDELLSVINSSELLSKKILLIGVTYALVDLAEKFNITHKGLIVMETGGMKGRRKEMIREELHKYLCENFKVDKIYSEYGMTELLSQAYSLGHGIFKTPPWMKVLIRDANDPFSYVSNEQGGGINIIDLANIYSSSFIMTQDLGRVHADGTFEILGRFDVSDIRGCNLLVQ